MSEPPKKKVSLTGIPQYITQNPVVYFPGVSFPVSPCM